MRFYTRNEVARLAGVKSNTMYLHVKAGRLPEPSVPIGGRMAYSEEAKDEIVRWYTTWRPWGSLCKEGK